MGGRAAQLCGRGQIFREPSARNFIDFLGPGIIGRSAPPLIMNACIIRNQATLKFHGRKKMLGKKFHSDLILLVSWYPV